MYNGDAGLNLGEGNADKFQISLRIGRAFGVEADFILVADMTHYERLTRKLFFDSGNVRKFNTFYRDGQCQVDAFGAAVINRHSPD